MARKTKGYLLFPRAEHDLESTFDYTVEHWIAAAGQGLFGITVTGYQL